MAVLPPQFADVPSALTSVGLVNVIGIVVDVLPSFRTRGSSYCVTFTIKDCDLDNGHVWDGLKIKYFNDNENYLPQIRCRDVVLLRNLRVRPLAGRPTAVAAQYEKIPWAVFRPALDASSSPSAMTGPVPFEPSYAEAKYAQLLLDRISDKTSVQGHLPRAQTPNAHVVQDSSRPKPPGHRPFLLIKDVEEGMYVNLLGEIVKAHFNDSDKVILHITDYTINKDLFDYGQENASREGDELGYLSRDWRGPKGRMTLQVTLWEPHASFAREHLKSKDFAWLNNVHIKRGRVARNLEASIHTDRMFPEKIHAKPAHDKNNGHVRGLLHRREQYLQEHGNPSDGREEISKKTKRKHRKKQEAKREEGQAQLQTGSAPFKRARPNENIQAVNPEIPPRSLEDIISNESHKNTSPDNIKYTLPFQNLCYRAFARVVDFFPPALEDFSVPLNGEPAIFSSSADQTGDPDDPVRWEWRFCLLVESAIPPPPGQPRERMKLFVSGNDAVYLLKIDATNLRRNSHALEELREKLFILWGDLEERKRKAIAEGEVNSQPLTSVSSVPFVCCVKEYGVECSHKNDPNRMQLDDPLCGHEGCFGWERRFAMFETVIHS